MSFLDSWIVVDDFQIIVHRLKSPKLFFSGAAQRSPLLGVPPAVLATTLGHGAGMRRVICAVGGRPVPWEKTQWLTVGLIC